MEDWSLVRVFVLLVRFNRVHSVGQSGYGWCEGRNVLGPSRVSWFSSRIDTPSNIHLSERVFCGVFIPDQMKLEAYSLSCTFDLKLGSSQHYPAPVLPAESHPAELHLTLFPLCLFLCCAWHNRGCDLDWPLKEKRLRWKWLMLQECISKTSQQVTALAGGKKPSRTRFW